MLYTKILAIPVKNISTITQVKNVDVVLELNWSQEAFPSKGFVTHDILLL